MTAGRKKENAAVSDCETNRDFNLDLCLEATDTQSRAGAGEAAAGASEDFCFGDK